MTDLFEFESEEDLVPIVFEGSFLDQGENLLFSYNMATESKEVSSLSQNEWDMDDKATFVDTKIFYKSNNDTVNDIDVENSCGNRSRSGSTNTSNVNIAGNNITNSFNGTNNISNNTASNPNNSASISNISNGMNTTSFFSNNNNTFNNNNTSNTNTNTNINTNTNTNNFNNNNNNYTNTNTNNNNTNTNTNNNNNNNNSNNNSNTNNGAGYYYNNTSNYNGSNMNNANNYNYSNIEEYNKNMYAMNSGYPIPNPNYNGYNFNIHSSNEINPNHYIGISPSVYYNNINPVNPSYNYPTFVISTAPTSDIADHNRRPNMYSVPTFTSALAQQQHLYPIKQEIPSPGREGRLSYSSSGSTTSTDDFSEGEFSFGEDNSEENELQILEIASKFTLPSSKSPIIEAMAFCAVHNWGISIVHNSDSLEDGARVVLLVKNFSQYCRFSRLICSKRHPTNNEGARIKALRRWFVKFPKKKERKNRESFLLEVKPDYCQKVHEMIERYTHD